VTGDPVVLVYPGAGTGADHPSLVAIDDALAATSAGIECRRLDFRYRREGRKAPDRAPKLMAEIRDHLADVGGRPVVLAGRSMGGRMASMVVAGADGEPPPADVVGLVLVAYPLHPPGRPDRLRVEHLSDISAPCLFVSGTRDPFGSPAELEGWTATIPGPVTHVWIDGARHELRGADADVAAHVTTFVARVTNRLGGSV
jgi:uncharacterized protein